MSVKNIYSKGLVNSKKLLITSNHFHFCAIRSKLICRKNIYQKVLNVGIIPRIKVNFYIAIAEFSNKILDKLDEKSPFQ